MALEFAENCKWSIRGNACPEIRYKIRGDILMKRFLSGSQGEGFAERNEIFPFETSSNCSKCSGKFIENIKLFNITNDIEVLYNIEKCETCYEQWENACSIKDERSIL